jgi:hypothetical protein
MKVLLAAVVLPLTFAGRHRGVLPVDGQDDDGHGQGE